MSRAKENSEEEGDDPLIRVPHNILKHFPKERVNFLLRNIGLDVTWDGATFRLGGSPSSSPSSSSTAADMGISSSTNLCRKRKFSKKRLSQGTNNEWGWGLNDRSQHGYGDCDPMSENGSDVMNDSFVNMLIPETKLGLECDTESSSVETEKVFGAEDSGSQWSGSAQAPVLERFRDRDRRTISPVMPILEAEGLRATSKRNGMLAIPRLRNRENGSSRRGGDLWKWDLDINLIERKGNCLFKCSDCGKGFENDWELTKHKKSHEDWRKPYKCCKCGKRYTTLYNVKRHIKKGHGNKSSYEVLEVPSEDNSPSADDLEDSLSATKNLENIIVANEVIDFLLETVEIIEMYRVADNDSVSFGPTDETQNVEVEDGPENDALVQHRGVEDEKVEIEADEDEMHDGEGGDDGELEVVEGVLENFDNLENISIGEGAVVLETNHKDVAKVLEHDEVENSIGEDAEIPEENDKNLAKVLDDKTGDDKANDDKTEPIVVVSNNKAHQNNNGIVNKTQPTKTCKFLWRPKAEITEKDGANGKKKSESVKCVFMWGLRK